LDVEKRNHDKYKSKIISLKEERASDEKERHAKI